MQELKKENTEKPLGLFSGANMNFLHSSRLLQNHENNESNLVP